VHSIGNKTNSHKRQQMHRLLSLKRPGQRNLICFQMEPYCPMSTFKSASVSPEEEEPPTHSLHTLYPRNTKKHVLFLLGVILLLAQVLRAFPHALVSHSIHRGLFFPQEISCLTVSPEQACPPITLWGTECPDQHIHLRNVRFPFIF